MRLTSPAAMAAALGLVLSLSGCGGTKDKSEADIKKELSQALRGSDAAGFDTATADCFAQIIIDEVGLKELQDVKLTADQPDSDLQDQIAAASARAANECDLSGASG